MQGAAGKVCRGDERERVAQTIEEDSRGAVGAAAGGGSPRTFISYNYWF